jgi:hypothetical protein
MLVLDVEKHVRGLFSIPEIAEKFQYCVEPRPHDVWDGFQMRDESPADKQEYIYLGLSCDSSNFRGQSWTPGTAVIYNFDVFDRNNTNLLMPMFGI